MKDKNGQEISIGDIVEFQRLQAGELKAQGEVIRFTELQVVIRYRKSSGYEEVRRVPESVRIVFYAKYS